MRVFGETQVKARKEYECNACLFIQEEITGGGRFEGASISDLRAIIQAKWDNWKIKKGLVHRKYSLNDSGTMYWGIRERLDMSKICDKYGLFQQ